MVGYSHYCAFKDSEGYDVVEITDENNIVWIPRTRGVCVNSQNDVTSSELEKGIIKFGVKNNQAFVEFEYGTKRYLAPQRPLNKETANKDAKFFSEPAHFRQTRVVYDDGKIGGLKVATGYWVIPKNREDLLRIGERDGSGLRLFSEIDGFLPEEGRHFSGEYVGDEYHEAVVEFCPSNF